jgi:hypothetical protein
MVRPADTNTATPLNIYDDELGEDMKSLPPSRPLTDLTPMTYVIYKSHLIGIFGQIVEAVQSLTCTSYENVMKLDQRLREIQASIPPIFKMRPIEESLRDRPEIVLQRYILDLLFLKSQCVLHRKFVFPSRDSTRFVYSRRTCIDNAMEMLRHQATLHQESRSGARLSTVQWSSSSLTAHDFLLAAMIVALDLYHTAEAERAGRRSSNDIYDWSHDRRANMLAALEQSRSIWEEFQDQSMEAMKAHGILTAMLNKLQAHEAQLRQQFQQVPGFAGNYSQGGMNGNEPNVAPEHSAAMTLGMLSTGALTPDATNMFAQYDRNQNQQSQTNQAQTSGLGSQFLGTGDQPNGAVSTPTPFLFGGAPGMGVLNMDPLPATNIDWVRISSRHHFPFPQNNADIKTTGCLGFIYPDIIYRPNQSKHE